MKGTERAMGETNAKGAHMQLYSIIKQADDNMIKRIKQVVDKVADRVIVFCFQKQTSKWVCHGVAFK